MPIKIWKKFDLLPNMICLKMVLTGSMTCQTQLQLIVLPTLLFHLAATPLHRSRQLHPRPRGLARTPQS